MNVVMIGPFGLRLKGTLNARALPMAKALVARGHSVTLLIPPWDDPAGAGRVQQEDGVSISNVPLPPRLPLLFHLWLTLRLVRHALALRPQAVHCFKPKGYAGLAHFTLWWLRRLRLARQRLSTGTRLVVDADDWERAWKAGATYSAAQQGVFGWQERWGLTHADAVLAASRGLVSLVEEMGVPPGRIFYVPNGAPSLAGQARHALIPEEAVYPTNTAYPGGTGHPAGTEHPADVSHPTGTRRPSGTTQAVRMLWELDDAAVILFYSDFFESRLERVVEILRRVVAQVPQAKLLVLGEGHLGEESELDELLTAAGLSEHAVFTGWVEPEQLPGYFAASDMAIFPTDDRLLNRTWCPAKLADLLAAGLAVVADAVGQNAEYITDGTSGLLVPPEDDAAFGKAVVSLLKDAELRARLGTGAVRRMEEHFAWSKLAEQVERAYR